MPWARKWIDRQLWDHRLRLMLDFDEQKVRWHRRHVTLKTLAHMFKSFLAKGAYEREDGKMGHPSLPAPRP